MPEVNIRYFHDGRLISENAQLSDLPRTGEVMKTSGGWRLVETVAWRLSESYGYYPIVCLTRETKELEDWVKEKNQWPTN